jgi:hypothetical protein
VSKKKWKSPLGVEQPARKLTKDEARKFQSNIEVILAAMGKTWAQSSDGDERDRQVLGALIMCGTIWPLPDWLYKALVEPLRDRLQRVKPSARFVRWQLMRYALDYEPCKWEEAPEWVAERLEYTEWRAQPETIRKDYEAYEKTLPLERRRPITHRRRS